MYKLLILFFIIFLTTVSAKEINLIAMARTSEVTAQMNEENALKLNAFLQAVTGELANLKLDSALFWSKLDSKKMSDVEEMQLLQNLFLNITMARIPTANEAKKAVAETPKISGNFKADLDLEKLKTLFLEVTTDLAETKLKTFYLLASIELENSMTWEDVGVQKAESFSGVILDSWKKLIEKDLGDISKVVILEKDFTTKPAYMNSKSVVLKWTSQLKKSGYNPENHLASFELSTHYVLQNAKSGLVLSSFDFPVQKRELDVQNKKGLSSALASLIYNLLLSQTEKIKNTVLANDKTSERTETEIKILTRVGLTEIYQINAFLEEKFKSIKLTSQMKSYSTVDGSTLLISGEGSLQNILENLSSEGGKYPINEQKLLLFNPTDKTFAILSKEQNN